MPWQVAFDSKTLVVEAQFSGRVPPEQLHAAFMEAFPVGQQNDAGRYLADCTLLEGGHSILDLYGLADLLEVVRPPQFREALLLPVSGLSQQDVQFWEDTCVNRGLQVRAFRQRDAALKWLMQAERVKEG